MKILLIDGGKQYAHSNGELNHTLHQVARDTLTALGHELKETVIVDGYSVEDEVAKQWWADVIVYQMPGWWMGLPWTVKQYIDEVFTTGHGTLYASDGRTRSDASKKYGSGGLMQGRRYMMSLTWNAPLEAFEDPEQFFEGKGVDTVYYPFHKSQEFVGLEALPTFMVNDVMKQPHVDLFKAQYQAHLENVLGKAE